MTIFVVIQQYYEDVVDIQACSDINKAIEYIHKQYNNQYPNKPATLEAVSASVKKLGGFSEWDVHNKILDNI